jgi:hypothetical protein
MLDDPDAEIRIEGIGGLAALANGLPIQTAVNASSLSYLQLPLGSPYQTPDTIANLAMGSQAIEQNEAKYLSFWKTWWADNMNAIVAPAH